MSCIFSAGDPCDIRWKGADRNYLCMAGPASLCAWGGNRIFLDEASLEDQ